MIGKRFEKKNILNVLQNVYQPKKQFFLYKFISPVFPVFPRRAATHENKIRIVKIAIVCLEKRKQKFNYYVILTTINNNNRMFCLRLRITAYKFTSDTKFILIFTKQYCVLLTYINRYWMIFIYCDIYFNRISM